MKRLLLTLLLLAGATAGARAAVCTVPNVIQNGTVIDATPVNQNFQALATCINNIDWSNIDSNGIYASQIIPISPGTATFGGNQNYTFSLGLIAQGGVVVDSTAVPNQGIAGGSATQDFVIKTNAGAGANNGYRFTTTTALPSSDPVAVFKQFIGPGFGPTYFTIDTQGDIVAGGGAALNGQTPDGSSLIGGKSGLPFWLISDAGSGAGSNFAAKNGADSIPAIVWENSHGSVIFTVDGAGNVQGLAFGVDNSTPPPNGVAGGTNGAPFEFFSNANNQNAAVEVRDRGTGNTNVFEANNNNNVTVMTVAQNGQVTVGSGGNTWIAGGGSQFSGTVAVPTVGPNQAVCTNSSSNLIGCGSSSSQFIGTATLSVSCSAANSPCTANTPTVVGLNGSFNCLASASWSGTPQLPIAGLNAGSNQLTVVFFNGTTATGVSNTATLYYRCTNP